MATPNGFYKRRSPIEVSSFVLVHLRLFQLLGLCPVSLQTIDKSSAQKDNSKYHLVWIYFNIAAFTVLHFMLITNHNTLLSQGDSFGRFNDTLKLCSAIAAHFITLFETLLKRRQMHDFLAIYSQLHRPWATLTTKREASTYRHFCLATYFFLLAWLGVDIFYTIEIYHRQRLGLFYFGFMLSVMLCRLRVVQIVFYLELLRIEVDHLNFKIERLGAFTIRLCQDGVDYSDDMKAKICTKIRHLMENYEEIYTMSEFLKECITWSMLGNYIKAYMKILSDLYWSYWMLYNAEGVVEYASVFPTALSIYILLVASRNCMRSTKYLAHNLHKFRIAVEDLHISIRIQNFSLQLLHQQIIIDVYGFFVMNCPMARDILGSITTYMIFFIQFMPKFKSA